ncbi:heptaprenyl diphosphate synthase component 1 [Rummeliibacillus sp. G93]|uniref:heptaprenyl diphosphate synthase component 1 n=1 Tax=Rummeliibacillus TaxID=648802 RepID=UPI00116DB67B|nr:MULTISPECIES: heptaprenyl diphosphate synthase component 1 [Rummeliibacillus]MBB5169723.1 heptaprenyl diphosphate synthase [Rummeliibacillus stabekisii]UQW98530.1 heptaprenyl diphosphate synthase component 1 [Rummeliibacillus sp. G93]GEL03980.1 hypothetical protein RST01_06070 [Rummeliibacillus stabekisii]
MNAAILEEHLLQSKNNILTKLHHRTLLQYTGQPIIFDGQLRYILLPKLNGEHWPKKIEQAVNAVAMVYAALNGHEQINEQDAATKRQQLTVLAGDYYSGMYYATLAKIPDIELVRSLSEAVAKSSESRTALYEPMKRSMDEWYKILEVIESTITCQFLKRFNLDSYIEIVKNGLVLERLKRELQSLQEKHMKTPFLKILEQQQEYAGMNNEQILRRLISNLSSRLIRIITASPILQDEVKTFMLQHVEVNVEAQITMKGVE